MHNRAQMSVKGIWRPYSRVCGYGKQALEHVQHFKAQSWFCICVRLGVLVGKIPPCPVLYQETCFCVMFRLVKKALVLTACSNLVSPQTCSPGRKKVGHLMHDPTWSNIFLNLNAWHGDVWNHSETLVLHLPQVSHSLLLDCYRLCRNTLPRWKKMQHEFHATFRWNMMTRGTKTGSKYIKFWSPHVDAELWTSM